jgi:hypothetical protein
MLVAPSRAQEAPIQLLDMTATSGLDFVHDDGADLEGYLVSMMGSGLGLFDYDNDGRIDAYLLNGTPLAPAAAQAAVGNGTPSHGLYRNLSAGPSAEAVPSPLRFANVTAPSHSGSQSTFGLGTAMADYDNDGFQDILVSNYGSITLLHNLGDGTFCDVTSAGGLADVGVAFGAGVAWLDIENDGDLDLYVADYVDFTLAEHQQLATRSYPYPPGPDRYPHRPDRLFRNEGNGTFIDWSRESGIADFPSPSMGIICGDFDRDGDTDVFVCCDATPNLYFVNDGQGVFSQEAELHAVAYNARGIPLGSMGVDAADIDNDGAADLFITNYSTQMPILFRNVGEFGFEDASTTSRAGRDVVPHVNWGAGLVDFDLDGDCDLMIANGHLFKWANEVEQLTTFKVRNTLLANDGRGRFANVTDAAGDGLSIVESSRGMAFDDLDNDGDVDCIVLNSDAPANLLMNRRNEVLPKANWVQFRLVGETFNRDGVGAKVTVEAGELIQTAEVRSGRGYQSHYGTRLTFGLGAHTQIDRVTVDWLGERLEFKDIEINQRHTLKQVVP